jgi:hypothetical protein
LVIPENRYISLIETYIEHRLEQAFPGFEMDAFMQQMQQREQEMDGSDVMEVLLSLGDFSTFKEIMLSYKTELGGSMFHVDVRSSVLHLPQVITVPFTLFHSRARDLHRFVSTQVAHSDSFDPSVEIRWWNGRIIRGSGHL